MTVGRETNRREGMVRNEPRAVKAKRTFGFGAPVPPLLERLNGEVLLHFPCSYPMLLMCELRVAEDGAFRVRRCPARFRRLTHGVSKPTKKIITGCAFRELFWWVSVCVCVAGGGGGGMKTPKTIFAANMQ